ncbi:CTD nuclear envelope phosphatase 1 [Sorochytrium milnesiophthora]
MCPAQSQESSHAVPSTVSTPSQYPTMLSNFPDFIRSSLAPSGKTATSTQQRDRTPPKTSSDKLKFLQALTKKPFATSAVDSVAKAVALSKPAAQVERDDEMVVNKVDPSALTRLDELDSALCDTEATLASEDGNGSHYSSKKASDADDGNVSTGSLLSLSDLPLSSVRTKKPVLVLDLDETLIHSTLAPRRPADFWIEVIQHGDERTREIFHVYKRPYVDHFLYEVAKHYDLVIFTAGIQEYASQILDRLDPDNRLFKARFYRDSCTEIRGAFVKDLTRVNLDLRQVFLVDNTPNCFSLQPANGLPIKSWYTDLSDKELPRLSAFLKSISKEEDMRLVLSDWAL